MAILGLRRMFRLQRYIVALLFVSFILGMVLGIILVSRSDATLFGMLHTEPGKEVNAPQQLTKVQSVLYGKVVQQPPGTLVKSQNVEAKTGNTDSKPQRRTPRPLLKVLIDKTKADEGQKSEDIDSEPSYNVHAFYYPWYGNPKFDKTYIHWNHKYLPHWDKKENGKWPNGQHTPPDDIGSNFYPELGPYSSRDPDVIENHMQQIISASIGVIAVSWYPPHQADDNGKPLDELMPQILDIADKYQVKVCFHIEPYKGRSHMNMKENIEYIVTRYGSHPAFYKFNYKGQKLPLYYIYDSYLVSKDDWAKIFQPYGPNTIRNTFADGIFIGLLVEEGHRSELLGCGFDGFYTYFASDGFTYGSSTRNWGGLAAFARMNGLLFIPSVGPGYVDTRVRPWNAHNTKEREHGGYYEQSFRASIACRPPAISITSFNEWHEGTQIEKSVPKVFGRSKYLDYSPQRSDYYLMLTRKWIHKYIKMPS